MAALIIIAATLGGAALGLWLTGALEPVYRISKGTWFVALRGGDAADVLASHVSILWAADSDFALIGADDPYWTRFLIVAGAGASPLVREAFDDAYVARLRMFAPPRIALGLIRVLASTGVLSRPSTTDAPTDARSLSGRSDVMPNPASIAALLAKPASYAPAMVNFLGYFRRARYEEGGSGRDAYRRYGMVALRTVYRTGGRLLFYGAVIETVRSPRAGPTMGPWDDIAAMRYPNPAAILSMERVPAYRAALAHRDAGLERTVVVASTPSQPPRHPSAPAADTSPA